MRLVSAYTAAGLFGVVARAHEARADKSPPTRSPAEQLASLKSAAKAAMVDPRYKDALALYREAYALSPDAALLYNQARALQAIDEHAEAVALLEKFASIAMAETKAKVPNLTTLIDESRAKVAELQVEVSVVGAEILLRERVVGTAPLAAPLRVNAGSATLVVSAEGYLPYREELVLEGKARRRVSVTLVPRANVGTLTVRTQIAGARVHLDGRPIGSSATDLSVSAGRHSLFAEADGYEPVAAAVDVARGGRRDVLLELKPRPSIVTRWWFWTGIGVVVSAGVGTSFTVTTERSAERGTIAPGQIATPLRF